MVTYSQFNTSSKNVIYTELQLDYNENGYWIDHFSDNEGDYEYSRIHWEFDNNGIVITFLLNNTTIIIHDYHIRDNHFTGYFQDYIHTHTDFDLLKTSPNCDSFEYDYGYGSGYIFSE